MRPFECRFVEVHGMHEGTGCRHIEGLLYKMTAEFLREEPTVQALTYRTMAIRAKDGRRGQGEGHGAAEAASCKKRVRPSVCCRIGHDRLSAAGCLREE